MNSVRALCYVTVVRATGARRTRGAVMNTRIIPTGIAVLAVAGLTACSGVPAAPEPRPAVSVTSAPTPSAVTASPEPTEAEAPVVPVGPSVSVLPYGTAVDGAFWSGSVDSVNATTANAIMSQGIIGQDSVAGQFVIVTVTVTNVSAVPQDPYDLDTAYAGGVFAFVGADRLLYESVTSYDDGALGSQPTALPGGTITGTIVFDVPPDAVGAGTVLATNGDTGDITLWSTDMSASL